DGIRGFHVTGVQTCALPIYFQYGRLLGDIPRCCLLSWRCGKRYGLESTLYLGRLFPIPSQAVPIICYPTAACRFSTGDESTVLRSEEHTSELQSREKLVCRL